MHMVQLQCEAWPISTHAHWHSMQDMQYVLRVLHLNAFIIRGKRERETDMWMV